MNLNKRMITLQPSKTTINIHLEANIQMFTGLGIYNTYMDNQELSRANLSLYDVIYLNWFENIDGGNAILPIIRYARRRFHIHRIKKAGLKVVFTKHNKYPHDTRYPFLSKDLYSRTCELADVIIAFNNDAVDDLKEIIPQKDFSKKINVINPINYIGAYPENPDSMFYDMLNPYLNAFVVTFVGKIMHYKNVELIINAARDLQEKNIVFIVAGSVETEEYKMHLENSVKGLGNIVTFFERVDDKDIAPLLDLSDILIMPYDKRSASNSGTGRLAFSYKKTVISPAISSMKLIPEELIYEYDYSSDDEHYQKMYDQLYRAYNDWVEDPYIIKDKGEKLYRLMETEYSKEAIALRYQKIFESLFSV